MTTPTTPPTRPPAAPGAPQRPEPGPEVGSGGSGASAGSTGVRQQIAKKLTLAFAHVAAKYSTTSGVSYEVLAGAAMGVIRPTLDAKDAEIERLTAKVGYMNASMAEAIRYGNDVASLLQTERERADQAEAERDRLKAAIEKAVNEDYECGGACEYGRGCPYMPELAIALKPKETP